MMMPVDASRNAVESCLVVISVNSIVTRKEKKSTNAWNPCLQDLVPLMRISSVTNPASGSLSVDINATNNATFLASVPAIVRTKGSNRSATPSNTRLNVKAPMASPPVPPQLRHHAVLPQRSCPHHI